VAIESNKRRNNVYRNMNKAFIKEKFKNLTVWKRGGQRAPHKPLMILYALGRLKKINDRLITYKTINDDVTRLLRDFGPFRQSYRPEFPFWRLQNDGVWEVINTDGISINKSGDVKKTELIERNATGGFIEEIYTAIKTDDQLFKDIVQELLDANFPSSIHDDILQSAGIQLDRKEGVKTRDPKFRNKILRAYEYRCAICGFDVRLDYTPIALEAAHIKWHNAGGPDIEANGLALCTMHHKLFDRGALTISENLDVIVSDRAHGSQGFDDWLMRFHRQKINNPQRTTYLPDSVFRDWHVREVFQGYGRD